MRRWGLLPTAIGAPAVALLLLVTAGGAGPNSTSFGADPPSHAAPFVIDRAASGEPRVAAGAQGVEPLPGKVYAPVVTPLAGVAQQSSVAIDTATGIVYALASHGGFLTESSLANGTLLASSVIDPNPLPGLASWVALCLAPADGRLFLSFESPGGGSVWVVSSTNLSLLSVIRTFADPSFEPGAILCDSSSGIVVVQGANDGAVDLINASTLNGAGFLTVCTLSCAPAGLVDVPAYGYIVPLEGGNSTRVIVPGFASLGPVLYSPSSTFRMGAGVYDAADNAVWIANRSLPTSTDLALFDAPGRGYVSSLHAPGPVAALAFAPQKNAVLLADSTAAGPPDRLDWMNASTGAPLVNDSASHPPGTAGLAVVSLAYATVGAAGYLLAIDPISTELFELGPLGPPEFLFLRALANVPTEYSITTDPDDGAVYLLQSATGDPTSSGMLLALNGSSGNLSWSVPLSGFSPASGAIAVDPALETLYVAESSGAVAMFDARNGSPLGSLSTPRGTVGVTVDPKLGLLDALAQPVAATTTNVSVFGLSASGAVPLGTFVVSGLAVCAWTSDTAVGALAVVDCGGAPAPDRLSWFSELDGAPEGSVHTGTAPSGVIADRAGVLYVANLGTENITIVNVSGPTVRSVLAGVVEPEYLSVDPTSQLLFVTGPLSASVRIESTANGASLGSFPLPSSAGAVAVNPGTGEVVATAYLTGQLLLAPLLAPPSQVGGVSVRASNGSLAVSWGPVPGVAGYPVHNYSVRLSTAGPAGPWTVAAIVTATATNLSGLNDGTTYTVTVAAAGETGTGPASAPVSAIPVGSPYPPTAVAVKPGSTTSLNVSWEAPISTGGSNLTGFLLAWALDAIGPWVNLSEPPTPTAATLGGLAASTEYFVRVSAESAVGVGNPSPAVSAHTSSVSVPTSGNSSGTEAIELAALVLGAAVVSLLGVYLYRRKKRSQSR
ncbi:MAG: fibronectin type III domain-containing protein [Thermoplasmata archaeon]|nr:fibronectin type III domain-containing protein [Thermoplasmata archaeon]